MRKKEIVDNSFIISKINIFRKLKGWSLYELSNQADLASATIYEWSSNKKQPSLTNIKKICKALEISLSQFFAVGSMESLNAYQVDLLAISDQMSDEQRSSLVIVAKTILK